MGSSGVSRSLRKKATPLSFRVKMRGLISFEIPQRSKNGVWVFGFRVGLYDVFTTVPQHFIQQYLIKPRHFTRNLLWIKVVVVFAFESKTSLVNVFDRASQPYHLSLSRPLHAGTHNLPNFVLTGVTQTAREMDGT